MILLTSFAAALTLMPAYALVISGNLVTDKSLIKRHTVKVSLFGKDGESRGICTGVIISPNLILTAGHCITKNEAFVDVEFGLGGSNQKGHIERSNTYRSYCGTCSGYSETPTSSVLKNGILTYDKASKDDFLRDVQGRTYLENFVGSSEPKKLDLMDVALIKVKSIPKGYTPVRFYKGSLVFNQELIAAGYGISNREYKKNEWVLRWSEMRLIGHYTELHKRTLAWQIYSPTDQQLCFGDSGGPLYIRVSESELQLIGSNILSYNYCANSAFSINVGYFESWLLDAGKAIGGAVHF
jgi:V8-like Glu-specific endopeptidase